ncbi:DUF4236 domain-containing protein [Paenibacillus radicis (ex Xue et al. 2023)]|uniref:DUF4236 domain-containing protein n=1 Tax=Paenibacillus radicis (ex Xue et al. 2023) TaxID=2972489 RepID=A0ABT1YEA8_9BACL|nr:DUF4236 domain-containing protein [Paenibacillus radicis (ex Xue et al. 2023)]MCR8631524.1 DUF4236 domain-containing protein [Paenibacillus radicis (ex Xue et al. 2023)]
MGFGFRKSIKIAPGIRLNMGSKSAGLSFGAKGLRYSVNSRTGSRVTASIPGTGISYTTSGTSGRARRTQAYRRQNELAKLQREYEKMQELQKARHEVESYENHIEMIHSIHKECDDLIDWSTVLSCPEPFLKGQAGPKESAAESALVNFKPRFFDKLFKRIERKREALSKKILDGRREDLEEYRIWEETVLLAKRINNGDTEGYLQVIEEMNPLDDLAEFGSGFEFYVGDDPNLIVVEFEVNSERVVPREVKTLTKTGKLSIKEISKSKYYDLEQDYVCSCVIRIARDMFALLPINQIFIHAIDERINSSNGLLERVPILSARIDRQILNKLNLDAIDCSDAMKNFDHRMKFLKTSGFQPILRLEVE